jgi:hypothetical protein
MIGRGEGWPMFEDQPMAGVAQLNLTESPYVPSQLEGIALISLWLAVSSDQLYFPDERPNGDGWQLRAYSSLDELVPTEGRVLDWVRPRQLEWESIDDYPDWDDLSTFLDDQQRSERSNLPQIGDALGWAASGTKLGGWPRLIQGDVLWAPGNQHPASPEYCLQVDNEEKVNLGLWDRGVIHIGLGSTAGVPTWVAATQFM